ncbi:PAS domain-containing protein, partial [Pseudomonas sp. 2995-1]|uniref:PAS domain-containing protein n=1 Tax=Pseudomonas sp. 2995-1 TaxID=1712679 RepID=UPI001C45E6AF
TDKQDHDVLYKNYPYPIYKINKKGYIFEANPSFHNFAGYTIEDLSQHFTSFVHKGDVKRVKGHFRLAMLGEPQEFE